MALHPVGPLPASTYWRRRAVLLLAVVVLLLLARSCLGGGGATPRPTARATSTPSASATAQPSATAGGPCPDSALKADAATDTNSYAVGDSPKISVTVTNTSSTACTRDLGPAAIEFVVFSGKERIWSNDDCGKGTTSSVVTLAPGSGKVLSITWSGRRSHPQCVGPRDQAKPGTYRVIAKVGTLESAAAVFHFR